jgi:hypothetical protein
MSLTKILKTALSTGAFAAVAAMGGLLSTPAHAVITLSAGDAICTSNENGGNDSTFLDDCGLTGLTFFYKSNQGGSEEGSFADDYETSFVPATEADITWDGPDKITCPTCYLIAKDGDSEPNWFLFDLGSWDGMETISLDPLFFKGTINQNFSHVSIWGEANGNGGGGGNGNGGGMPEPGTLALAGIALLGAAVARRRQRR